MSTISLAMIVKNEEKVLLRCLKSFKPFVDEIIVVDTGSTDNTINIAKKFTKHIYHFKWCDDFSKARNFSFSKCKKDYILWVDADDVFDISCTSKFLKLKQNLFNYDIVMLPYNIAFDEQNNATFSYYRERIIKNNNKHFWQDAVHEFIEPKGKIFYENININHKPINKNYSDRNLKIYKRMLSQNVELSHRQQYYYARELMFNNDIQNAILEFKKYLNNDNLWKENAISACRDLANCYIKIGNKKQAKTVLLNSLVYDSPRAETSCELGNIFLFEGNLELAIFWFQTALNCTPNLKNCGFVENYYYNLIPYLQLCVCYYKLGDLKKSVYYNNLVGNINPKHKSYLHNKAFFDQLV